MKEIILIKNGELALKGLNRHTFEDILIKNMRWRLKGLGKFKFSKAQSTIYIEPQEEAIDLDEVVERLKKVFGLAALSRALVAPKDMEAIKEMGAPYLEDVLMGAKTFKVEAKRADKLFPLKSPEICAEMGGYLLEKYPHLTVDVHKPDVSVRVEVRDFGAYIHAGQIQGAGGMPVSSGGKATLLISGGIDSPVAGYMMAKRGLSLNAVHFESPPYTSERAKLKVMSLLKKMGEYSGNCDLYVVPFTKIQTEIRDKCDEDLFTIIMRRIMMRIAQRIARDTGSEALVTGESVGQVASQTLAAIACTNAVCEMPVLRPLVGMDKSEIVTISRKIETFDISILPYEDCCTVFTPKHPRTRPNMEMVLENESRLDMAGLINEAMGNLAKEKIFAYNE